MIFEGKKQGCLEIVGAGTKIPNCLFTSCWALKQKHMFDSIVISSFSNGDVCSPGPKVSDTADRIPPPKKHAMLTTFFLIKCFQAGPSIKTCAILLLSPPPFWDLFENFHPSKLFNSPCLVEIFFQFSPVNRAWR